MRTTIDLDDRVLAILRSRARASGSSLGAAVSELVEAALAAERDLVVASRDGFPIIEAAPGHVITDELVSRYRDDEP